MGGHFHQSVKARLFFIELSQSYSKESESSICLHDVYSYSRYRFARPWVALEPLLFEFIQGKV